MFNARVTGGVIAALAASTLIAAPAHAIEGSSVANPLAPSYAQSGTLTWATQGTNTTFQLDAKDSRLAENGTGTLDFDGKFLTRSGATEVELDDVKVRIDGTTATLTADYDVDEIVNGRKVERSGDNVVLGTFTLTENIDTTKPAYTTGALALTPAATVPADIAAYVPQTATLNLNLGKVNPLAPDFGSSENDPADTGDVLEIVGIVLGVLAGVGALGALVAGPLKDQLPFKLPF